MMPPPLANGLLKQLTLPVSKRRLSHGCDPNLLCGAQFFECSEIFELSQKIAAQFRDVINGNTMLNENSDAEERITGKIPYPRECFLPSDHLWIEYVHDKIRHGILLKKQSSGELNGRLFQRFVNDDRVLVDPAIDFKLDFVDCVYSIAAGEELRLNYTAATQNTTPENILRNSLFIFLARAPAFLCIINSPKWTRQIVNKSHGRAARVLRDGKWPLLGWRTVKLNVDRSEHEKVADREPTGHRPLHHVNAHLRWIEGRQDWTKVREHWRGDASIGQIRQQHIAVRDLDPRKRLSAADYPRTEKMAR